MTLAIPNTGPIIKPVPSAPLWPSELPDIRTMEAPARLLVPLGRDQNEERVKSAGSRVAAGEALLMRGDELAHMPIAPVAGTLGRTSSCQLTSGKTCPAVELIAEGNEQSPNRTWDDIPESDLVGWLDWLRSAGVWSDRHASPDFVGQLNHGLTRPMEWVICTALDTDSGLRMNAAIAARYANEVAQGTALLGRITRARSVALVMEADAALQWSMPARAAAQTAGIRTVDLPNDYPQSDPTLIMYSVAGRRFRPERNILPAAHGLFVLDAASALALWQARQGTMMAAVPLAVHDHIREQAHLLWAPVGSILKDVLAWLLVESEGMMLRGGDLLRDIQLSDQAVIGGGELTIHVTPPELPARPEPCVRCGWCLEACPTRAQPAGILEAAQRNDGDMAQKAGIGACIECGLCSHVCPSRLPLLEAARFMRLPPT